MAMTPVFTAAPESLSDTALEDSITTLAAHIHAATYRLLVLLRELDRRGSWADPGLRSCAHWLNWKCGIALGAAREKLRVAHALETLPATSAAFERGELSYSKVRAITRVATPVNEHALLNIALHGTAAHVEQVVRGYRRVGALEERAQAERVHRERRLRWWWDEDGALVLEARLAPEAGARVIAALKALVEEIEREEAAGEAERAGPGVEDGWGCATAEAPAAPTEGKDVSAGTPPLDPGGGEAMEQRATEDYAGEDVPAETRIERLRRWAAGLPARRADALVRLCERAAAAPADPETRPNPCEIVVHVDAALLAGAAPGEPERAERCELEEGARLPVETARRLACDGAIVALLEGAGGEPLAIGRRTRAVPAPMRRAVAARDRGCRFPGCTARRRLEAHHVRHWARGGETSARNLASLCPTHHRLVHEGGYGMEVLDDGQLRFTAPGGAPIPECPGAPRLEPGEVEAALLAAERAAGAAVGPRTCVPDWDGHGLDRVAAVEGVLAAEGRLRR